MTMDIGIANRRLLTRALAFGLAVMVVACDPDVSNPTGPLVSVCHIEGSVGSVTDILLTKLPEHRRHGDYLTLLEVDKAGPKGDSIHFTRVTDALAAASAGRAARGETTKAACRITISVAPGLLKGSTSLPADPGIELFPLVIDVPDITLRGAMKMEVDAAERATGVALPGDVTTFAPSPALILKGTSSMTSVSERIIVVNSHPAGSSGDGAIIEGFAFQSGRAATDTTVGGVGIGTLRARGLVIRGNRFEGGFNSSIDLQASSALVERNHLSGRGSSCDLCLAGPGDYVARNNRILGGGIPGILILPTGSFPVPDGVEPYTLPATALVTAVITNNEVKDHLRKPVGVGLRVGAVGVAASSVAGTSKVTFTGNNLVNNTFGIIIEAAFLSATGRRGDIEVTTSGNSFSQSCQNDVLVSLSPSQTGLGIQNQLYLQNSTYNLRLGPDVPWEKAWYANAPGFGNTLTVNGETIAGGSRAVYNASKVCG